MSYGKQGVMLTVGLAAAGALAGLLSFGVYGKLRDKKWKTWSAGALTGAIGGLLGGIGAWATLPSWAPYYRQGGSSSLSGLTIDPISGLGAIHATKLPRMIAGLTMDRLSGLQVNGLSMNQLPLGAYAVDPQTLQIM